MASNKKSTHSAEPLLQAIAAARPGTDAISGSEFRDWMNSTYPEVRAEAYALLSEVGNRISHIDPQEEEAFRLRHLEETISKGAETEHIPSRMFASQQLREWFVRLWMRRPATKSQLANVK